MLVVFVLTEQTRKATSTFTFCRSTAKNISAHRDILQQHPPLVSLLQTRTLRPRKPKNLTSSDVVYVKNNLHTPHVILSANLLSPVNDGTSSKEAQKLDLQ